MAVPDIPLSVVQTWIIVLALPAKPMCVCHPQVFKQPWPGIMRTLYGKHQQFETVYFKKFPGYYVTGDGKGGSRLLWAQGMGTAVGILPCPALRIPYQLL